jgi:hypothetical protein
LSSLQYDPLTGLRKTSGSNRSVLGGDPFSDWLGTGGAATTPTSALPTGTSTTPVTAGQQPGLNTQSYMDILRSDPIYNQTLADLSAQGISDRSQADTLAQRALVQFGEVPALEGLDSRLAGPEFGRISGVARPLAEANTASGMSIVARMERLRKENVRAIKNALASRGALRSGESGYQLGQEQERYTTAQYDARSQLVDLLAGIEAGYANAQRGRSAAQGQAATQAMGSAIQYGYQPAPQATPPVSSLSPLMYPNNLVQLPGSNLPPSGQEPQRRYALPTTGTKLGSSSDRRYE